MKHDSVFNVQFHESSFQSKAVWQRPSIMIFSSGLPSWHAVQWNDINDSKERMFSKLAFKCRGLNHLLPNLCQDDDGCTMMFFACSKRCFNLAEGLRSFHCLTPAKVWSIEPMDFSCSFHPEACLLSCVVGRNLLPVNALAEHQALSFTKNKLAFSSLAARVLAARCWLPEYWWPEN